MRSKLVFSFLGAGLVGLALSMSSAHAGTVLVFGQNGTSDQFTATNDGSTGVAGGTTLSAVNSGVTITGIANSVALPGSFPDSPEIERVFEKRSKNGGTKKTTISKK